MKWIKQNMHKVRLAENHQQIKLSLQIQKTNLIDTIQLAKKTTVQLRRRLHESQSTQGKHTARSNAGPNLEG